MLITAGGRRQLIVWHPQAANGMNPDTGELYWTVKLEPDYGMSINGATLMGNHLFIGGIKNKALMLALDSNPPSVREIWRPDLRMGVAPVHTPPVPVGDVFYAVNRNGELTAVEIATGKRLWETMKVTTGGRPANSATAFLVRNEDRFYIMSESGELIIARLTPEKYDELDRAKILEPTHEAFGRSVVWSHPAFANKSVYARNDKEIVCVQLGK
jgi:outer membrane protein assembly factor BamB